MYLLLSPDSGDLAFTDEITRFVDIATVATKEAISPQVAKLTHPSVVTKRLSETVARALGNLGSAKTFTIGMPVRIRMRFATTTQAHVLQAIPGMTRVDGYTVGYTAKNMEEAYKLIRLMYKYVRT